jgi:hypothetical protein
MNIMTTTTTLRNTGAFGESISVFDSKDDDISPAPERRPAAKNRVLPRRAQCLRPPRESLKMNPRQPYPCLSSPERGGAHEGHRDSFRSPGCAGAVHSWHRCRHWGNSNRGRRCSIRSQDHTARRRQPVEHTPPNNRSAVVLGVRRRVIFQNGRRVLADSELDDGPPSDQVSAISFTGICSSSHGFSRKPGWIPRRPPITRTLYIARMYLAPSSMQCVCHGKNASHDRLRVAVTFCVCDGMSGQRITSPLQARNCYPDG